MSKQWTCPFCTSRNMFPPHYAEHISDARLPTEVYPQCTTVEYEMPGKVAPPPAFVFVLDACLPEDELADLKDSVSQALSLLPPTALVGLVTFGTMVTAHELSPAAADVPRSYVLKGSKDYEVVQIATLLGLPGPGGAGAGAAGGAAVGGAGAAPGAVAGGAGGGNRFLAPLSSCAMQLERILEDMARDPWPCPTDQRPARATGLGLRVASAILQRGIGQHGGRIVLCTGGPCTLGPGTVVDRGYDKTMRSHMDISKGNAPHIKAATAWFAGLAASISKHGHALDFFACSLDQIGLLEMRPCVSSTGGLLVMADSFKQSVFKESFRRLFRSYDDGHPDAGHLLQGYSAMLEVNTSRDFKVSGAMGHCVSLDKKGPVVSETEVGQGGTYAWSLGAVDPCSTVTLYFDVTGKEAGGTAAPGKRHHLQLVTVYQHSKGAYRMRVTTIAGEWSSDAPTGPPLAVAASFDQEAAAVVMARIAVTRAETEDTNDVLNWLDRSLIRLCQRFGEYRKDDASSFRLGKQFSLFPQFMFHLRRSPLLQTFNSSPDEASYHRLVFMREHVGNSILMVQPSLQCYSFSHPTAFPVALDAASVRPDVVLLLDTFFYVLLFHGETIAQWRNEGWDKREGQDLFRALLQNPKDDAADIMGERFPVSRYIECDQHKSQARFLMARVNPSVTHNNAAEGAAAGSMPVLTDDVSLNVFMEHLTKFSVASS